MTTTLDVSGSIAKLDAVSKKISQHLADVQGSLPEHLFHYTNSAGLRGIVRYQKIWATHYRFLNDASEIDYGLFVLDSTIDFLKAKHKDPIALMFLNELHDTANAFSHIDFYIACFCSKDDLLHQWRDYAGNGGYAIGFNARVLLERSGYADRPAPGFQLRKVIYDVATQEDLIRTALEWTIGELQEMTVGFSVDAVRPIVEGCVYRVQNHVAEFITMFKHKSFEAEHEWRLCYMTHSMDTKHIDFRDGQFGLTPFVELAPINPFLDKLPIDVITHAPTKEANNVRFALNALLRVSGYENNVQIKGSIIPIRAR